MNFLALDTSSNACSVALRFDGQTSERYAVEPKGHTRLLLPMIREILDDAGATLARLDALILGNGPGSFIGLRIAASVAQGLAFAAGLKIVPVSSLAAVAAECMLTDGAANVAVAQDARMGEVYLGLFSAGSDGVPAAVAKEVLHGSAPIPELGQGHWTAAGSGWQRYPALREANRDRLSAISEVALPRANYLLRCGAVAWRAGAAIEPAELVPAYLRMKVAEKPAIEPSRIPNSTNR